MVNAWRAPIERRRDGGGPLTRLTTSVSKRASLRDAADRMTHEMDKIENSYDVSPLVTLPH